MGLFMSKQKKYNSIMKKINELNKQNENGYDTFYQYVYYDKIMMNYFDELKKLERNYSELHVDSYETFEQNIFEQLERIYNNMLTNIFKEENLSVRKEKLEEFRTDVRKGFGYGFDKIMSKFSDDIDEKINNFDKYIIDDSYNNLSEDEIDEHNPITGECGDYEDPLYDQIVEFAVSTGKVSAALIQRRFRLGYNRCARVIDLLEERGIIGPANGSKPRDVLVKYFDDNGKYNSFKNITPNIRKLTETEIKTRKEKQNRDKMSIEDIMKQYNINTNYSDDNDLIDNIDNLLLLNYDNNRKCELINELLKFNSPQIMKLVLISFDPLSFSEYNGIPHLMCPVVTDNKKSEIVLEKILSEMEKRYDLFLSNRVKSIDSYNNLNNNKIPYIIIIIDEIFNALNDKAIFSTLTRLLLNCKRAGIKVISFSKFNKRNLLLGPIDDLLDTYDKYNINKIFGIDKDKHNIEMDEIDNVMDGFDFEKYAGKLLSDNGFEKVYVTKCSNDFGVDIIAYKDDIKYSIQCKKYSSTVGINAVQEVIASKVMNDSHVAVVLTNNYFTKSAKELANKNNVLLWDRDKLERLIEESKK